MACSSCRRCPWSLDRKSEGGGETQEPGSEHISELLLRARYCHDTNAKLLGKLYHVLGNYEGRYSFYEGRLASELCFT